jgi:transcriptional regulator with XRE-family HTH domain/tetratricopeptide (TPR) repeat protein
MQKTGRSAGDRRMSAPSRLADRLRALRNGADLTLEELSERSGVSVRTLSDIERGVSKAPQRRTMESIADGLALEGVAREGLLRAARARRAAAQTRNEGVAIPPRHVRDFTGRDREIARIVESLDAAGDADSPPPVLVICGAPGVGKTTSAVEALRRRRGEWPLVMFLDLDGFNSVPLTPLQVMRRLLRQVPGVGDDVPTDLDAAVRLWGTVSAAQSPAVLLDNAASESQVRPVLAVDTRGPVLITSRRTLSGLESAQRVMLGPLEPEESAVLLGRLIPPDQLGATGDLDALAALCDNVPLALRIAGNRIASQPARSVADFVSRMGSEENRLRLLVAGDLAIESAFALSYDDLEPETAALFRALAVIDGATFDARLAAATVGADVLDTEARLDELTDLGLLEARGGNRYRLHDLLRLFASARLRREDGTDAAGERKARLRTWLLSTVERAGSWFEPARTPETPGAQGAAFPDRDTARAWIQLEVIHWWPAYRSAAVVGDHELVADVADALHWFSDLWVAWGHWNELYALSVAATHALGDQRLHAMHLGYLAWTEIVELGDPEAALVTAHRAFAAADEADDDTQRGWAHLYASWARSRSGLIDEAVVDARAAILAFHRSADRDGSAQAIAQAAQLQRLGGDHEAALIEYRAIVAQVTEQTDGINGSTRQFTASSALHDIATSLLELGRPAEAAVAATEALAFAREIGWESGCAVSLSWRANARLDLGDLVAAESDLDEAAELLGSGGDDHFRNVQRAKLDELRGLLERARTTP